MTNHTATLRQITDAIATFRGKDGEERDRLYSRARTMRDRGLILTASHRSQGREIQYSAADIAAAVVAITISLNGGSTGQIEAINRDLRDIGNGFSKTQGYPAFETHLNAIMAGEGVFIRFDILSQPWEQTCAKMGKWVDLNINPQFATFDAENNLFVITQTNLFPVTTLVQPIFSALFGQE